MRQKILNNLRNIQRSVEQFDENRLVVSSFNMATILSLMAKKSMDVKLTLR